jgi:hypothetical protein
MKNLNKVLFIIYLLTFIFFNKLLSQDIINPDKKGEITGSVISANTKSPIPGITIRIEGTNFGAYSDKEGKFIIKNIPVGMYQVKFTGIGYNTYVQTDVSVTTSKQAQLLLELSEKVIQLKGTEVRASYFQKRVETATSTQSLSYEDIRRAPGVQEDVIRATALLPGVGVTQAGRNDLVVRGGAPFENLFVVDNIEISNINHFGSQGTSGGPLSLVNLDFVKNVTFSAGGFGAKYGDKVSSMTNITLRNGNEDKLGGKAVLSATGFGVNFEGPISDNSSFLFSARRSYLDFIFKAAGFGFIPEYWDFQGKINYRLNNKNNFSFLTIGALDDVKLNNEDGDKRYDNSRVAIPSQKQYFSGLTWQHLFETGFLTITLGETYTNYFTFQNDSNLVEVFKNKSRESESILRTDVDFQLFDKLQLTFGNQVKWATSLEYNILIPGYMRKNNLGDTSGLYVDTSFRAYKNATYLSLTTTIDNFKFTLGSRLDFYNYLVNELFFSPRASFIYQINPVSAIVLSLGRYYQAPSYIWLIGDKNQSFNPIQADQIVLGYDHTPLEDLKVQLEVYYKFYSNYPARVFRPQAVLSPSGFDDITSDIPYGLEPLESIGKGFSRGVELFIQKKMGDIPLYGLLSISLSETKFQSIDGKERFGAFDTRAIFNLSLGYRFNPEWEVSGKFRAATGLPTTPFLPSGTLDYTDYNNGERLPTFHALDLRADKRWFFTNFTLVTYIDIQNIYSRQNVSGIKWNYRTSSTEYQKSIGILPTIGVSFEF